MAVYTANKVVKTLTIHKETCNGLRNLHLVAVGKGEKKVIRDGIAKATSP